MRRVLPLWPLYRRFPVDDEAHRGRDSVIDRVERRPQRARLRTLRMSEGVVQARCSAVPGRRSVRGRTRNMGISPGDCGLPGLRLRPPRIGRALAARSSPSAWLSQLREGHMGFNYYLASGVHTTSGRPPPPPAPHTSPHFLFSFRRFTEACNLKLTNGARSLRATASELRVRQGNWSARGLLGHVAGSACWPPRASPHPPSLLSLSSLRFSPLPQFHLYALSVMHHAGAARQSYLPSSHNSSRSSFCLFTPLLVAHCVMVYFKLL